MDTKSAKATLIVMLSFVSCIANADTQEFAMSINRSYCRTNTWNGCCVFDEGLSTRFWEWKLPHHEISSAVHAARHYARYGKRLSVVSYHEEPLTENSGCDKAWSLNFHQFPSVVPNEIVVKDEAISLSDLDVRVLPFKVTNPSSKTDLFCVLAEFLHEGEFCFAVYVNINNGKASLDFHDVVSVGWILIAAESRYPYLTVRECEVQTQVYLKYFSEQKSKDAKGENGCLGNKEIRDGKINRLRQPEAAFNVENDVEVEF